MVHDLKRKGKTNLLPSESKLHCFNLKKTLNELIGGQNILTSYQLVSEMKGERKVNTHTEISINRYENIKTKHADRWQINSAVKEGETDEVEEEKYEGHSQPSVSLPFPLDLITPAVTFPSRQKAIKTI